MNQRVIPLKARSDPINKREHAHRAPRLRERAAHPRRRALRSVPHPARRAAQPRRGVAGQLPAFPDGRLRQGLSSVRRAPQRAACLRGKIAEPLASARSRVADVAGSVARVSSSAVKAMLNALTRTARGMHWAAAAATGGGGTRTVCSGVAAFIVAVIELVPTRLLDTCRGGDTATARCLCPDSLPGKLFSLAHRPGRHLRRRGHARARRGLPLSSNGGAGRASSRRCGGGGVIKVVRVGIAGARAGCASSCGRSSCCCCRARWRAGRRTALSDRTLDLVRLLRGLRHTLAPLAGRRRAYGRMHPWGHIADLSWTC